MANSRINARLKVGDTIYRFNPDNRVYANGSHSPIYREFWQPQVITGETPRSWLIGKHNPTKVSKATLTTARDFRGWPTRYVASLEEVERDVWVHDNRPVLTRIVERCNNYEVLRQIEALLHKGKEGHNG